MKQYTVTVMPGARVMEVEAGTRLMDALVRAGVGLDAPCGGRGTCGKCRVRLQDGREVQACRTSVEENTTVYLPENGKARILAVESEEALAADGGCSYALAFDIGTTTVVCCLMDGRSGVLLSRSSCINPQNRFGADVISRIQYAMGQDPDAPAEVIRRALEDLAAETCREAGIPPEQVGIISVVGNTAMHHLLLKIDPRPLTVPPYMPNRREAMEMPASEVLPTFPRAVLRCLPNIAGFVGGDTVGCMVAVRFDRVEALTLLIDIGTNGEMVLGNSQRRITCSTAAGPAFEGAKIRCGMRGAEGAVDHVWLEDGALRWSVIGGKDAVGLCGSGLLDLVAVLLERGDIDETGRFREKKPVTLEGTPVFLTQKDVREVQLAKAAIRAGIELLCRKLGVTPAEIQRVYLAGAFGNYLNPDSACAIGMIPHVLRSRIRPVGNAAGEGAMRCAVSREEYDYSKQLAAGTEFLELASVPEFNDCYVDCLGFEEEAQ